MQWFEVQRHLLSQVAQTLQRLQLLHEPVKERTVDEDMRLVLNAADHTVREAGGTLTCENGCFLSGETE